MIVFILFTLQLDTTKIEDKWISIDKFHHFFYSMSITAISYHITNCKLKIRSAKIVSISICASLGLCKEIYDKYKKKKFSYKDLLFDFLGIAASSVFL